MLIDQINKILNILKVTKLTHQKSGVQVRISFNDNPHDTVANSALAQSARQMPEMSTYNRSQGPLFSKDIASVSSKCKPFNGEFKAHLTLVLGLPGILLI